MRRTVRIICDAESHASKVAKIDRIEFDDEHMAEHPADRPNTRGDRVGLHDRREDARVFLDARDDAVDVVALFGTSRRAPTRSDAAELRQRFGLECPICGLRVVMRRERLETLAFGLAKAGVSQISLSALAASM